MRSAVLLVTLFLLAAATASAQSRLDAYFGLGSARADSTNQTVDLIGDGVPRTTSSMGGVFGTVGGGVMLTPSLGVGGELVFRFAQGDYAGLGYRPIFYDFNGIWTPSLGSTRVIPELQGGLGGVNLRFYGGSQYYDYNTGTYTNYLGSSNHFQLHASAGLRLYVWEKVFLRPQFDYRWVHNMTEFNGSSVLAFSLAIGISMGQ